MKAPGPVTSQGWRSAAPENDGDFFYSGETPDGKEVVAIVQIYTDTEGRRSACLLIPPNWRGDAGEMGAVHCGELGLWNGEWSGPELGLCTATGAE